MSREARVFGIGLLGDLGRVHTAASSFERLSGKALGAQGLTRRTTPLVANGGAFSAR